MAKLPCPKNPPPVLLVSTNAASMKGSCLLALDVSGCLSKPRLTESGRLFSASLGKGRDVRSSIGFLQAMKQGCLDFTPWTVLA